MEMMGPLPTPAAAGAPAASPHTPYTITVSSKSAHFTIDLTVHSSTTVLEVKRLVEAETAKHIRVPHQRMVRLRLPEERGNAESNCLSAKTAPLVDEFTLGESNVVAGSTLYVLARKAFLPRPPDASNWCEVIFRVWDDSESSMMGQVVSICILVLIIMSCIGFVLETCAPFQTETRTLVPAVQWNHTAWLGTLDAGATATPNDAGMERFAPLFAEHSVTTMRWVRALDTRLLKDMGIVSIRDRAVLMRAIAHLDPYDGLKEEYVYDEPTPHVGFFWLEVFCMTFFTIEYVSRLLTVTAMPWSHLDRDTDAEEVDGSIDSGGSRTASAEGGLSRRLFGAGGNEEEEMWGALLDVTDLGTWERGQCVARARKMTYKLFRRSKRESAQRPELSCVDCLCGVVPLKEHALARVLHPANVVKWGVVGDNILEMPIWVPRFEGSRTTARTFLCDGAEFGVHAAVKVVVFATDLLNLIDLVAILPFYITLIGGSGLGGLAVLRVLRLSRVFRVLKLGKYSRSLHAFARVIKKSFNALAVLVLFMLLTMVLCGSLIFYAERGEFDETTGKYMRPNIMNNAMEESPFKSIPFGFWWVIVSITTVGYGDFVPTTVLGKIVGVVTVFIGILTLAMPITVIGSNFSQDFVEHSEDYSTFAGDFGKVTAKVQQHRRKSMAAAAAALEGKSAKVAPLFPSDAKRE